MKKKASKKRSSKKKSSPLFLLFIALFLLISALVLLRFSGIGAAPGSDSFKQVVSSTQLMQNAKLVKQDLKDIASQMKDNDITSMEYSSRKLDADVAVLKEYLSTPIWTVAEVVPVLGQDVKTAKALVEISEVFSNDLLKSWIELQKKTPYTELKTEDGYNYELFDTYLDYAGENLPAVKSMVDRLSRLNLRLVDENGKITSYIRMAQPLLELADEHFDDLIRPGLSMIAAHPPSGLKTEDGRYDLEFIKLYYGFLTEHLPEARSMVEELDAADLSLVDSDGRIKSYLRLAKPLLGIVDKYASPVIDPGLALLSEHPLSDLKTEEKGFDFDAIGLYSDFLFEKRSSLEAMLSELEEVDYSPLKQADKLRELLATAQQLMKVGAPANEKLLRPALRLLADYPLSSIRTDEGYNVRIILAYLDFIEEGYPDIQSLCTELTRLDLSQIDPNGKITKYIDKLAELQGMLEIYKEYIPAARVLFGNGEQDRYYLFPVQNSAEIRASGGFPGNACTIYIHDGILSFSEFFSGYGAFTSNTPGKAKITAQELRLFTARMYAPRDADFCIDFERVAQIWAYGFEALYRVLPDGVISGTPLVVQKILAACDASITLSNGMVLDGTTATRVLQRDIYFEYKRAGMNVNADVDMTDILFSEAVKQTMDVIASSLNPSKLLALLSAFKECVEERIVLVWMPDEEEQEVMRQAGWSGSLNSDPEDPKLGIFFSSEQSSKMGYFFDMIPEIGEPVVNEDGSCTYDVTLTLNNVISKEEQRIGGTWILGRNYVGSVVGDLTLTAPAGGTISDTRLSIARGMRQELYHGLDTHYIQWLIIERQSPIYVYFKVTTAPGVDAPLGIMATPTMTDYRS